MIRVLGPISEAPGRGRDGEICLGLTDKISAAAGRLLAAGELAEVVFPDGRTSTTFVLPEAQLENETRLLNDPALTQELLSTIMRVARSRRECGR
jgi:hypothetical protein